MTPFYYPKIGGAEIYSQNLAQYLVKKKYQVDVVNLSSVNRKMKIEWLNRVPIHRLPMGRIRYLSFVVGFCRLFFYLYRLDQSKNYDLFHSVGDGLAPLAANLIKKIRKKKHLNTIQGLVIFEEEGRRNIIVKMFLTFLYRFNFKNVDLVHAVSRAVKKAIIYFGAQNVVIIPNGVDTRIFKPLNKDKIRKKYGVKENDKIVVAAARLIKRKGIDYLINAIAGLEDRVTGLRLIVIGEGPEYQNLKSQILNLKIEKSANLIGAVPHRKMAGYINLADIFVIPSLYEPFGIVAVEAMACGTPVIGSRVDGLSEIIEDGKNGFLVPANNHKKLQEKIFYLLGNRKIRNKFSQAGLARIKKNFLWNNVLAQITKLY